MQGTVPANGAASVAMPLMAKAGPTLTIKERITLVQCGQTGPLCPAWWGVTAGATSADGMAIVFQGRTNSFPSNNNAKN